MCVSLSSLALPTMSAGALQATAAVANGLGDLAAGATRARMMRQEAAGMQAAAGAKAKRIRAEGERALGTTRAGAVAAGVSLSSQSVMDAERSTVQRVEQDALSAILTGDSQAAALRQGAGYYQAAGISSAFDSLADGYGRWKNVRAPAPQVGWEGILNSTRGTGD